MIYIFIGKADSSRLNYKRGKPPDKRRHQMEMNQYTDLIQGKEALFVSFAFLLYRNVNSSLSNIFVYLS